MSGNAPSDTFLESRVRVNLQTVYRRSDLGITPRSTTDHLNYSEISHVFRNGRGTDKTNLQFHSRRRLIDSSEQLDLDDGSLKNKWEQALDYDAVKIIIVKNRETKNETKLKVQFKDEIYYIGPNGSRTVIEPLETGVQSIVSSASQEEGRITFTATGDVTFDIIIIGTDKERSSTTSGE